MYFLVLVIYTVKNPTARQFWLEIGPGGSIFLQLARHEENTD
jgi:hypothetical protein